MPQHRILTFAAAADICGGASVQLDLPEGSTVADLRRHLIERHPGLGELSDFAIARNQVFAGPQDAIGVGDELAVIPPVSGG